MSVDFFYKSAFGRFVFQVIQKIGMFKLAAWFMHTSASKVMISKFIKNNQIDMKPFKGQTYHSFSDFFARKKEAVDFEKDPSVLMSPCDGLLSIYSIEENLNIPMKGSHYRLIDIIPDEALASTFQGGLCLVFRLRGQDYHHFCAFDEMDLIQTHFIEGQLHSVQPIAIETVPVYRLNRRWWSVLETEHFGKVIQIEVGAMAVGGVSFAKEKGYFKRGEEMGNFELAGSTIVLIVDREQRKNLQFFESYEQEVPVQMGQKIAKK